ncbi:MAG: LacI family DNA-binding transcriptional regulator [Filifactoraceae bacterium]
MTITIKDVARMAGVSISTVSRVINSSKPVSSDIKDRVEKIIEETGYVPNPVARSLVMKKSQFIGVVVPDISNPKIAEILNGVEMVGRMYDYDILLCNSYGELLEEERYINLLVSKQVAAMIFVTWKLEEDIVKYIKDTKIPTVFISKNASLFDVHSVGIDHFAASKELGEVLGEKGYKKIGFIRTSVDEDNEGYAVYEGFKDGLNKYGIDINKQQLKHGDAGFESGYEIATEWINENKLPEVVFATNDETAIGAMNAFRDKGYNVPDDVSVIGYDDIKLCEMTRPKLATIRQPLYDIGAVSIRMAVKLIKGEEVKENKVYLNYQIVERESLK